MAARVPITKQMVEAFKKSLRITECPACKQELDYHSWVEVANVGGRRKLSETTCSILDPSRKKR